MEISDENPPRTLEILDIHYNKVEINLDKWVSDIYEHVVQGFSEFAIEKSIIERTQDHTEAIISAQMVNGNEEIRNKLIAYLKNLNSKRWNELRSRAQQNAEKLESLRKELGIEVEEKKELIRGEKDFGV